MTKIKTEASEDLQEEVQEEVITLDEYVLRESPNPGLIASYKVEASEDIGTLKTIEAWGKALEAQAQKEYR